MSIKRPRHGVARSALAILGLAFILWVPRSIADVGTTPLILERNEGEQRTRRPRDLSMPAAAFIIKVDRQNGGSQRMWLGTEEIPPGGGIQRHRHLGQDEILLIQTGIAHVHLGTEEKDAHAGAVVFIPSGTWIGLKNIGAEHLRLAFVFSDPGFDDYLRCTSAPAGEASLRVTAAELDECRRQGHLELDDALQPRPR